MGKTEYTAYVYPARPTSPEDIPRKITGTNKQELIQRARYEECCLYFELYNGDKLLESQEYQSTGSWRIKHA